MVYDEDKEELKDGKKRFNMVRLKKQETFHIFLKEQIDICVGLHVALHVVNKI